MLHSAYLILPYSSADITFLITNKLCIKQFNITARGVQLCGVKKNVYAKYISSTLTLTFSTTPFKSTF